MEKCTVDQESFVYAKQMSNKLFFIKKRMDNLQFLRSEGRNIIFKEIIDLLHTNRPIPWEENF
ncbi:hypothetical protein CW304_13815 [Bacillus sp. UFRGS-B20]|nr:hypothetical protein CW304_13815 [Bacillus sp. UFRGS-B20]